MHRRRNVSTYLVFRKMDIRRGVALPYFPADTIDLSLGGVRIGTGEHLSVGEALKIRLRLFEILTRRDDADLEEIAEYNELVAVARIMNSERLEDGSFQYGLKFERFLQGNLGALASFLESGRG